MNMADYTVKTVPRRKTIVNIFKFLQNPIPLINEVMVDFNAPSYRVHIGGMNKSLMTKDPIIIQHVLQKNHKNYHKSEIQSVHLARYAGKGLLTTDGDYWLRQRRLIQPGFHKQKLKSIFGIMNQVIIDHVKEIAQAVEHDKLTELDVSNDMTSLTLKVVSYALFGADISDDQLRILSDAVLTAQIAVTKDIRQPIFKWWRRLSGQQKKYDAVMSEGRTLLMSLITERKKSGINNDDLLDMLLSSRYEDTGEAMSNEQLLDEILIIFAAGHETTALAMSWTLYLLDKHPRVLQKLKDQIRDINIPSSPDFNDLANLDYCRQVISESMRLYPPAWITDRIALEDDMVNGHKIFKGEILGLYIYGTHRSPELWDDPDAFIPERFEKDKMKSIPSYAYLPFGGGPRLCIGQQFAWVEMQLALFHLIRHFNFNLKKGHKIELSPMITLRSKYGMPMSVKLR